MGIKVNPRTIPRDRTSLIADIVDLLDGDDVADSGILLALEGNARRTKAVERSSGASAVLRTVLHGLVDRYLLAAILVRPK